MTEHNHSNSKGFTDLNQRFILGVLLNISFVLIEAGCGIYYNSMALLSDAGHNLSDVASLLLAMLAFRLAKIKPDQRYTYGYKKITILISLLNAIILLVAMGGIIWESVLRIKIPTVTNGSPIVLVAGIGIIINAFTAFLFLRDKEKDLNIKGAYLHMLSDALVSFGVLLAGILIIYTNLQWLDSVISIAIAFLVLLSTFGLLKDSFKLSIDAVPEGINLNHLKQDIEKINGVIEIHQIHIWAISTTLTALTAHVKIGEELDWRNIIRIKNEIRNTLLHQNIQHSTIEFEFLEEECDASNNLL